MSHPGGAKASHLLNTMETIIAGSNEALSSENDLGRNLAHPLNVYHENSR